MPETVRTWLFDPTVGKMVTVAIALLVVFTLVRLLQRSVSRYVQDVDTRYRARKIVMFLGYATAAVVVTTVYSNRLGGFTWRLGWPAPALPSPSRK